MPHPADLQASLRRIDDALAKGDAGLGVSLARELTQEAPDEAAGWTALGVAQSQAGSATEAEASLRKAIALAPEGPEPYPWLANLLRLAGRREEAMETVDAGLRRQPHDATAQGLRGNLLLELGDVRGAEAAFAAAERLDPDAAVHAHNRGLALQRIGDLDAAAGAFRRATQLAPQVANSYISLAQLLLRLNEVEESIRSFRDAHRCESNTLRGGLQLAQALIEEKAYAEAEALLRRLSAAETRSEQALLLLGRLLQRLGRFEEAEASLREALNRRPDNGRVFYDIAYGRKIRAEDFEFVEAMRRLREETPPAHPNRVFLDYGLGKAYDDLGRYGEAMARYDEANAAMRAQMGEDAFDPGPHRAYYDELIAGFHRERFARYDGYRDPSDQPVFIIGMIRSGTTLVDQILSSHPGVASIDEHPYWPRHLAHFFGPGGEPPGDDAVKALTDGYLQVLCKHGGDHARVTNKLPTNFALVGPIHLLFPKARFVHIRRNPLDNLLSIYATRFPNPVRYAHDKAKLVAYYREYQRLMEHWRSVVPQNRLLEIDYETLVADGEPTIRRMVEFLDLPWDDRCLRPEANPREIRTPSAWQARQPIFTRSVERWRRYEPWLGEFAALKP